MNAPTKGDTITYKLTYCGLVCYVYMVIAYISILKFLDYLQEIWRKKFQEKNIRKFLSKVYRKGIENA